MKTLGLLGGMSWESTELYHRWINERVRLRRGGLHSAPLLLWSPDFASIAALQAAGRWDRAGEALAGAAAFLERAGAQLLVLCTNTMHEVAPAIEAAVTIPLLHIADPTGEALWVDGVRRVGLLGTRFTMERDFYRQRLAERFSLEVLIPDEPDRSTVHRVVYEELVHGKVEDASRAAYVAVIERLVARGAEAVILGCTEITLLIGPADSPVPVYDTTRLHAEAAVDLAL